MKIMVLRDSIMLPSLINAGVREELSNVIWMITPTDTPILRAFATPGA